VTAGVSFGADAELHVTIEDVVDGRAETTVLAGRFRIEGHSEQGSAEARLVFLVDDKTDGSQKLTTTLNGKAMADLGCFHVGVDLSLESESYRLRDPLGVLVIHGRGLCSIQSSGDLVFPNGTYLESGGLAFWPMSIVLPCGGVNVSGGGVDSNDSTFSLTATGGGNVTLAGVDASGDPFSLATTWSELD
jgi:hypothetical protein